MNGWQQMVREFQAMIGDPRRETPGLVDTETAVLRYVLKHEEFGETVVGVLRGDLPAIVDGIADQIFVLLGFAEKLGVDMEPIFYAVYRANMAKAGGPTDARGKRQKPPGWTPPDIAGLLRAQGWKGEP